MTLKILAIPGSLRHDSYNKWLLRAAVTHAPSGTEVEVVEDLASIPFFNEDLEQRTEGDPAPVIRLRNRVAAADGLLISTPEYNHSIPGVLKNAIDWLSRGAAPVLEGKPVAVVGASSGSWGTRLAQAALRQVLNATDCVLLPGQALYIREARKAFDESGNLIDERVQRSLTKVLQAHTRWIQRQPSRD
jgi:chromate reductase